MNIYYYSYQLEYSLREYSSSPLLFFTFFIFTKLKYLRGSSAERVTECEHCEDRGSTPSCIQFVLPRCTSQGCSFNVLCHSRMSNLPVSHTQQTEFHTFYTDCKPQLMAFMGETEILWVLANQVTSSPAA